MKYIRKKRSLENYTIRSIPKSTLTTDADGKIIIDINNPKNYYGTIPQYKIDKEGNFILTPNGQKIPNTVDFDLFLTQDIDDMGLFTDAPYVPLVNELTVKPSNFNSFSYGRLAGAPLNFYFSPSFNVSGNTDDNLLKQVKSYRKDANGNDIYVNNLNTSDDSSEIYNGVISQNSEEVKYKIGSNVNDIPNTGVEFTTSKNKYITKTSEFGKTYSYFETIFETQNGGWNQYNTSISAIIKKEEYLGVVFQPEVESAVFINRGVADIFERHALLSEIKTTNDIDTNRKGFIRI
tara:strand:- start:476 stop:1351 length:876 start_codon:yes stop_codon:yes gene_type:complete